MHKADRDDSTPPDSGDNPEADPAAPRSAPGYSSFPGHPPPQAPPEPPPPLPLYVPPAPFGFAPFLVAPYELASNEAAWDIPPGRLPSDRTDLWTYSAMIEAVLADGCWPFRYWRAAGIREDTGDHVWVPSETWRTFGLLNRRRVGVAFLALLGQPIQLPLHPELGSIRCYPVLPKRWLAMIFGARKPPAPPPRRVLRGIREMQGKHGTAPPAEAARVTSDQGPIYMTGAAGKPSSMWLVRPEFRRRQEAGTVLDTLTAEAEWLAAWRERTHPDAPPLGASAIRNGIRDEFNAYAQNRRPK